MSYFSNTIMSNHALWSYMYDFALSNVLDLNTTSVLIVLAKIVTLLTDKWEKGVSCFLNFLQKCKYTCSSELPSFLPGSLRNV